MNHLKQLLLIILVLSTLGYSSAWAFDEHVLDQFDIDSNELVMVSDADNVSADLPGAEKHDEHNNVESACDHCCHISSHLVAIFSDAGCTATNNISIYLPRLSVGIQSFIPDPERKPPRV